MSATLILSLVLVAYNNLINRWGPFHGAAYVPVNLAFTAAVTIPAVFVLSAASIGLQGDLGDLLLPVVLVAIFAIVMFGLASSRQAHRIADRRVAGMHGPALAFYVLVRIPLGTAVTEELVFRGCCSPRGRRRARRISGPPWPRRSRSACGTSRRRSSVCG